MTSLMSHDTLLRILGLDVIRALTVAAVTIYHADVQHFLPGGFLGVDVFFLITGFLITRLLFRELDISGTIRFSNFYVRRSRRLLSALRREIISSVRKPAERWLSPQKPIDVSVERRTGARRML